MKAQNWTLGLLGLVAGSAFAATTGQINLSGTVGVNYEISVSQAAAATNLDIVGGESGTNVATVTEITNNPLGYKVTIQSQNSGLLVHDSVASSTVNYDISYNGSTIDPDGTVQDARTEASSAVFPGNTSAVTITFAGLGTSALAGTYSDQLDLVIQAP